MAKNKLEAKVVRMTDRAVALSEKPNSELTAEERKFLCEYFCLVVKLAKEEGFKDKAIDDLVSEYEKLR